MLLVFGLSVPITQIDNGAAWSWTLALWLRCTTSFLAGLWLIHVLPFPELLATLHRWHCPTLFVAMLAFMYRYLFILWEEFTRHCARPRSPRFWSSVAHQTLVAQCPTDWLAAVAGDGTRGTNSSRDAGPWLGRVRRRPSTSIPENPHDRLGEQTSTRTAATVVSVPQWPHGPG